LSILQSFDLGTSALHSIPAEISSG
jgi:hypothetical protein